MYSWWHAPQRYVLMPACTGTYPGHHLGIRTTVNPCYGIEDRERGGRAVRTWCICSCHPHNQPEEYEDLDF